MIPPTTGFNEQRSACTLVEVKDLINAELPPFSKRVAPRQNALIALWYDGGQVAGLSVPRKTSTREGV